MKKDLPDLPNPGQQDKKPWLSANKGVDAFIDDLNLEELLRARTRIESRLPARNLQDINLANELVLQLLALQQAQSRALEGKRPANPC
jgi:hypothetical protein